MNTHTSFIIFTSDRSVLSEPMNVLRRELLEKQLRHRGLSFKPVDGVYKGTTEHAYLVLVDSDRDEAICLELARRNEQESVLHVDANRVATLLYLNPPSNVAPIRGADIARAEPVGFWHKAGVHDLPLPDSYTRDGNDVYVTRVAL